jgi:hypothetical protein
MKYRFLIGAAWTGVVFFGSGNAAAAGLFEDLLKTTCLSELNAGTLTMNGKVQRGRSSFTVHPWRDGGDSSETCSSFTWSWLSAQPITSAAVSWRGRVAADAEDCSHSVLAWAIYKKNPSQPWSFSWVGGGSSYGNFVNNTCVYDKTGAPVNKNWGSFSASTGTSNTHDYVVGFQAWSHDDPSFGHTEDDCADPISCFWPIGVNLGGTLVPPLQDYTIWRPGDGMWWVKDSVTGAVSSRQWGDPNDKPVVGDFDGDGNSDYAVWRPGDGYWHIIRSGTDTIHSQQWGLSGDVPVPADYDGDGKTDIAVWRPSNGTWYIILSAVGIGVTRQWGLSTDKPVPGQFDEDLRADLAVYRPSNGNWYIVNSFDNTFRTEAWGTSTSVPVGADYTGDGRAEVATWHSSTGNWGIKTVGTFQWGASTDIPVRGYINADKASDLIVFRPSNGTWYTKLMGSSTTGSMQWGQNGDVPLGGFARNGN